MPMTDTVITSIDCPDLSIFKKGKVRSVFDFGDTLLLVASDRVSAFDFILPNGIPGKGAILTQLGLTRYCCRTHMIGHVQIIDKL